MASQIKRIFWKLLDLFQSYVMKTVDCKCVDIAKCTMSLGIGPLSDKTSCHICSQFMVLQDKNKLRITRKDKKVNSNHVVQKEGLGLALFDKDLVQTAFLKLVLLYCPRDCTARPYLVSCITVLWPQLPLLVLYKKAPLLTSSPPNTVPALHSILVSCCLQLLPPSLVSPAVHSWD